ncbi:MAG TPA: alginate export family protein [Steroidobacteraceae bacterium]|nr:alginate export family protein [Steroidobacteraceae bacterium]
MRMIRPLCFTLGLAACAAAHAELKPILDTRLRYESVEQDGMAQTAEAMTLRGRLGFVTGKVADTALLVEGEFVRPVIDDYNSTTNGHGAYPVIADPRSSELNRLQLTNTTLPGTTLTAGRQRIVLDDHRFVGNVGWRQNEQTFDAIRIVNKSVPHLILDVTWLDQVNRVFGRDSAQGRYLGDSVLANASYEMTPGKLTGFAYRIAIDPIAGVPGAVRDSSQTFGVRFAGSRPVDAVKLSYVASYANQHEAARNPLSFDLDYYLGEISAGYGAYTLGAGLEILEGDGSKGFTTPFATLHRFQGWADKFLATPANGIDDRYVTAALSRQRWAELDGFSVVATYHRYTAERGSMRYGSELDLQAEAKWRRVTGVLKYADYEADRLLTDTTKWWLQLEYAW